MKAHQRHTRTHSGAAFRMRLPSGGFTLVELLVTVVIVTLLASIALP